MCFLYFCVICEHIGTVSILPAFTQAIFCSLTIPSLPAQEKGQELKADLLHHPGSGMERVETWVFSLLLSFSFG